MPSPASGSGPPAPMRPPHQAGMVVWGRVQRGPTGPEGMGRPDPAPGPVARAEDYGG